MVLKKIWEAVFGIGWDTVSLERHVMCSEVVKSPQSTGTIFHESREGLRGCRSGELFLA